MGFGPAHIVTVENVGHSNLRDRAGTNVAALQMSATS